MVGVGAAASEERKIITVLFADLVGFTSRSERLDPEDVRALLSPYYARLRQELGRFGGTVEKFIGDAVVALFGAPAAHEDDPERAVRAALAIRSWVLEQEADLQLRIAVNTGEALVVLGAQTTEGESMASGDVVNTTARLQAAAPVNGILVGEVTYRATSHVINYRATEAVRAKGKAKPVPAWEALEARSRFGADMTPASRNPLVGREHEMGVLSDALKRVRRERSPQLVTLVGVPGMGKSRLLAELFGSVEADPSEAVYWRQGRSLPYGEGVTFWALSEMVKAQAGILETDPPDTADGKLRAAVAAIIPERADAQWVEGHLRPLVGLSGGGEAGSDRREEAFVAWRRFFEALAEQHPLVLVFEDLHWADENLLDFVEHLVDWAGGVPILVVCSTRPELFERRAGWGGRARNATTLSLSPLSEDETARLISTLSERPVMPAETQEALLTRAGGNPLYAEQYVRMLEERGEGEDLPLPETVQGIIAARLDGLPTEEKHLLQNAAVMGKVFWLGAVADSGLDRHAAELHLHALERKDFVHRARRSSVTEEVEYTFLHVLVRDVAYGQIPRGRRAEQHRLAAEWIASLGRTEDHAEMLAHHYMNTIDLRRAAGQTVDAGLAERALDSLRDAGDRAFSLDAHTSAVRFYRSALELVGAASLERAHLLFKLGRSRFLAGDLDPASLTAACDELLACGDVETAAEAEENLGTLFWTRGDRDRAFEHGARARELVEDREASRVKAYVLSSNARYLTLAEENTEAIRLGREALTMAEQLSLDVVRARALISIGASRLHSGDPRGVEDLEQSVAIAVAGSAPSEICRSQENLASGLWEQGQLTRASVLREEAEESAGRFGQIDQRRWCHWERVGDQYALGRWGEALASADELLGDVEAGLPHYLAPLCYAVRALIRLGREDIVAALADVERSLTLARLAKDPQSLYPTMAAGAHVLRESGRPERAALLADELLAELKGGRALGSVIPALHMFCWTLSALGRADALVETLPSTDNPWIQATRAFATGDVRRSAEVCEAMGAVSEGARDRLWLAEDLIKQNRRTEADVELQRALTFYRSVGAIRYIREGEALFAASA
jgi:class 3 adenylate cyclase/tetratricopeptide (TPR) repeat protein